MDHSKRERKKLKIKYELNCFNESTMDTITMEKVHNITFSNIGMGKIKKIRCNYISMDMIYYII